MDNTFFFIIFNIVIVLLVLFDLFFVSKNISLRKAVVLTFFWIFLALAFSIVVYIKEGQDYFFEYLTAYFVEKSLSVDNIFVFLLIFQKLSITTEYQRTLLFAGIWGALILRATMIFAVGEILSAFHFMIYVFGAFLLFAGISSFISEVSNEKTAENEKESQNQNKEEQEKRIKFNIEKYFNIYNGDHAGRFLVKENNHWKITILLVGIIYIEICDIIFAFDSIPALFSITTSKTIIYTSNAFAIIGLRSLYIAFAVAVERFYYLKYGVSVILSYIGMKMIFADYIDISPQISLGIILTILLIAFIASETRVHFMKTNKENSL